MDFLILVCTARCEWLQLLPALLLSDTCTMIQLPTTELLATLLVLIESINSVETSQSDDYRVDAVAPLQMALTSELTLWKTALETAHALERCQ